MNPRLHCVSRGSTATHIYILVRGFLCKSNTGWAQGDDFNHSVADVGIFRKLGQYQGCWCPGPFNRYTWIRYCTGVIISWNHKICRVFNSPWFCCLFLVEIRMQKGELVLTQRRLWWWRVHNWILIEVLPLLLNMGHWVMGFITMPISLSKMLHRLCNLCILKFQLQISIIELLINILSILSFYPIILTGSEVSIFFSIRRHYQVNSLIQLFDNVFSTRVPDFC